MEGWYRRLFRKTSQNAPFRASSLSQTWPKRWFVHNALTRYLPDCHRCIVGYSLHSAYKFCPIGHMQQLFNFSLKACLALVAVGEASLIFLSDFSGYMFDVVILSLAFAMTVYCFVRAIRNYTSDVQKLGL